MSTIVSDAYSDIDLQDPAEYYGGFKEGRVMKWGESDRALSDFTTGDWHGSQFTFTIADPDRRLREQIVSAANRYWNQPLSVYMTTRANRGVLGEPYPVFIGPIVSAQPVRPLAWEITLSDIVSRGLISDEVMIPWRLIGDGFLDQLSVVAESLDRTTPEPIIYGQHRRIVDVDPPSPQGFAYTPTYLGIETITAQDWHVWMIAGHACADIPDVLVDGVSVLGDEGDEWLIPHHTGHDTEFGASYVDRRSMTYGNDRRYTLLFGKLTDLEAADEDLTDPDACALGRKILTVFVDGVEPSGDGTGTVITDRFLQYKHFAVNFIAHQGAQSYQAGAWLANPSWDLPHGAAVPIIETSSFDACAAIGVGRIGDGYIGAAVIGARAGTRASARKWIADWNRSCGAQQGITHKGQFRVCLLHPTEAIKAAAPLVTDAYEILDGSFEVSLGYPEQANRVPFVADYHHETATWKTQDAATAEESVLGYGREITAETREYPFAPGITMAWHLARLTVLTTKDPPIRVVFEGTVGPDAAGDSLGYLDLGDYVRYLHYAAPGARGEIRLAQVQRHQVLAGSRRVRIEARDCEDLIGYDAVIEGGEEPTGNETCDTAIEIPGDAAVYALDLNTTENPTDASVEGLFPGSGVAYHAAWWTVTPDADKELDLSTLGSLYDTQVAVFTGTCGALELVEYNDNRGSLTTSGLTIPVTGGVQLFILVAGYGPEDGGFLHFAIALYEPPP